MFKNKREEVLNNRIQELENELNLYKTIIENVPISVFAKNVKDEYRYIIWNKELEKLFGTNKSEIIGINDYDLFTNKNEAEYFRNYDESVMNGKTIVDISSEELTTKFGTKIVHTRKIPIYSEKNEPQLLLGCLEDITQKLKTEQNLRESELKFREIIQQINDVIIVFNQKKEIIVWNTGAEFIFGKKAEDAIGKSIADVQFEFALPELKNKGFIDTIIEGIISLNSSEAFNKIIDNEIFVENENRKKTIESKVFPIVLENEILYCIVIRDVTDKRKTEADLIRLNEDKDRFISILSHDLRAPFNSLLGFSGLLIDNFDKYDKIKVKKLLHIMNQSIVKTYDLLEDILSWSKSQSNKLPFNPQKIKFSEICSEIEIHFKESLSSKEITLNYDKNSDLEFIADLNMFKSIIRNLVSNAIKFSNRSGIINILGEKKFEKFIFAVSDQGIGIDSDALDKLWKINEKFSSVGTEGEKGTGFGLIICKDFVEKHNGRIWAESSPGKGSKFIFTIPE